MNTFTNIHPGEILEEEFLKPMDISDYRLAKSIDVAQITISLIRRGKRGISADMALRLSKFFGTTPEFWMNLQREYDLRKERTDKSDVLKGITPYAMGA